MNIIAEQLYIDSFKKYIPPSSKLWDDCFVMLPPSKIKSMEMIEKYLKSGQKFKAGYSASSIRGYHNHWIFYKDSIIK